MAIVAETCPGCGRQVEGRFGNPYRCHKCGQSWDPGNPACALFCLGPYIVTDGTGRATEGERDD